MKSSMHGSTRRGASAAAILLTIICGPAFATLRYTEARIVQIETSDLGIYVFLEYVSGDALPAGNGGTNEPLSKPYLILADSSNLPSRDHMIASAMLALTSNTMVRFRWDDAGSTPSLISHLLLRQ
jgi:hypothetical protein